MEMVPIRSQSKCHVNYFTFHEEDKNKLDWDWKNHSMPSVPRSLHLCSLQHGFIYFLTYRWILSFMVTQATLQLPNSCYDLGGWCGWFVFNILPNLSIFSSRLLLLTTFNYSILYRMTQYCTQSHSTVFFFNLIPGWLRQTHGLNKKEMTNERLLYNLFSSS